MSDSAIGESSFTTETKTDPLSERYASAVRILDERRRAALKEIDEAKFSYVRAFDIPWHTREVDIVLARWWHAKVCVVAGIGFFTDAYVVDRQRRVLLTMRKP